MMKSIVRANSNSESVLNKMQQQEEEEKDEE